jgi:hypothetical protein
LTQADFWIMPSRQCETWKLLSFLGERPKFPGPLNRPPLPSLVSKLLSPIGGGAEFQDHPLVSNLLSLLGGGAEFRDHASPGLETVLPFRWRSRVSRPPSLVSKLLSPIGGGAEFQDHPLVSNLLSLLGGGAEFQDHPLWSLNCSSLETTPSLVSNLLSLIGGGAEFGDHPLWSRNCSLL